MKKFILFISLVAFTGVSMNSFAQDGGKKTNSSTTTKKASKKKSSSCCQGGSETHSCDKKKTETK